ncbi:SpoIIE family protein phosphatase [Rubrivirga sp. S365]|uniref:SpoIIE family protein phosphatase n=1 Tax=Rubrivirga litoralis TaxID=3075598 RepID=A0ABU3BSC1_9BACT|nr:MULTISPECIES: SpoIIE family protein phosphatase [unclassified Rubrivirga]MDT0632182.1 SpoIIE family protein phosphatase [Rubrivirga sp. F394]MDT7856792.1 SpoIIE family protein phosphatase [Rubrivirga sp. S365]
MTNKPSVLVAEDNTTLRRLLEYRLGKQFDVRVAENGERALALVEEQAPDLIVSDIMMPVMDGFALLAALQADPATEAIPFIFLTAKSDDVARQQGLRKGVDDYLTKPFDVDHLVTRVGQIVQRSQVYQSRLTAKIGRDFSDRLLPRDMPSEPGYRAVFFSRPKEDGGGDLFDWTRAEDGSYLFTVGDIMGKGLQAKFYAFSFLSYIRSTVHVMLRETRSPAALMTRVNETLINDQVLEETFASLLILRWEPEHDRVTYANAGHCRPILASPDGPGIVEHSDLILGLDPGAVYQDRTLDLPPGSALLCYTDGLNEQVARSGAMFGEGGVALGAQAALENGRPVHALLSWLLRRSEVPRFEDDVLVFWLQREADRAAKAA